MTTSVHAVPSVPLWDDRDRAVVVGVDGSEANRAAIRWAGQEAADTHRPLCLLTVSGDFPSIRDSEAWLSREQAEGVARLRELAEQIQLDHPGLVTSRDFEMGHPVPTLLKATAGQGMLVVGRRGLGAFGRLLVGSTSIGVAGRSDIPVVIVPDDWDAESHRTGAIAVGVDAEDVHEQSLQYAFIEADRRQVGLTVVHAPHLYSDIAWDPTYYVDLREAALSAGVEALEAVLAPYRAAYPSVQVQTRVALAHPGELLLQQEPDAQLLVLGRKRDGHFGFAFGSISRGVLHYAATPVAVVPTI